jgi:hypothetical protein
MARKNQTTLTGRILQWEYRTGEPRALCLVTADRQAYVIEPGGQAAEMARRMGEWLEVDGELGRRRRNQGIRVTAVREANEDDWAGDWKGDMEDDDEDW